MEKVLLFAGAMLLVAAVVCVGLYAWSGNWIAVWASVGLFLGGRLALGLVEVVLSPLGFGLVAVAKRRTGFLVLTVAALFALIHRAGFAAFCAIVLVFFLGAKGAPAWLGVMLATVVCSAPFAWAAQQTKDETDPRQLDTLAAVLGTAFSGALALFGVDSPYFLLPTAVLFFCSACAYVVWFLRTRAPTLRLEGLVEGID